MFFIFKLLLSFTLFAESYTEIKDIKVSSSEVEQYDIRKDLNQKAIQKASNQEIMKILGPKMYKAYKNKIIKNIIPQSNKYISSITPLKINVKAPNSIGTYSIRMSQESLMSLLRQNGMFYSVNTRMKVLPLVVYRDQVDSKNYFWWGGNSPFSSRRGKSIIKSFHSAMAGEFKKDKFSVITPIKNMTFKKVPVGQQFLKLNSADVKAIARATGANVVIFGEVTVGKGMMKNETYTVDYDLKAVQVEGMKILSTVKKSYTSLPGSFKASMRQLLRRSNKSIVSKLETNLKEFWGSGHIGERTYTITLKGNLKYKQYKSFKKDLITNIGAVNSINEKNFRPGTIVLELSSPSSLNTVAERLKKSKFSKYKVNVSQDSKSSLELDIQSW